ncbi:HlyD family secretion protein [Phenylobacterium sp.]|uniref:HlyD family secretion protein n=1 Tax=Phenylobacterium sp. TaxID=1871053 RepID=UPI00121BC153|nr:HlyD family secretion protein [Phenylobacterium sp.]THD58150.1 MAG: HlyD family secretion protein [Phenylobacterium sp.]
MADQSSSDEKPREGGQGGGGNPPAEGGRQGGDGKPPPKKKPNPLKNPKVLIIGGIVIVVLAIGGVFYWLHARQYVSTDDAFVDTHIVRLAPQVSGEVMRVLVVDNAVVKAGQVLVEIDSSTVRAQLDQAQAQRGQAIAQIGQAQAQVGVSQASYRQARDQARGLDAQAAQAQSDARRLTGLQATNPRAVAAQQVDQTVAQARQTTAQRDAALRQADGAAAQVKAARTQIEGAKAVLAAANATISENNITLGRTTIVAPVAGYVSQKTVAAGGYVQPGQQLMAIVPLEMWVTANFKETQLKNMRAGQPVDLSVDACPVKLHGKVNSIQRGAGQAFSLLPSENATGNYVKVVQRVPVKITFEDVPRTCPLGPGLSVSPTVKVR